MFYGPYTIHVVEALGKGCFCVQNVSGTSLKNFHRLKQIAGDSNSISPNRKKVEWVSKLGPTNEDKQILESGTVLVDKYMHASMLLTCKLLQ